MENSIRNVITDKVGKMKTILKSKKKSYKDTEYTVLQENNEIVFSRSFVGGAWTLDTLDLNTKLVKQRTSISYIVTKYLEKRFKDINDLIKADEYYSNEMKRLDINNLSYIFHNFSIVVDNTALGKEKIKVDIYDNGQMFICMDDNSDEIRDSWSCVNDIKTTRSIGRDFRFKLKHLNLDWIRYAIQERALYIDEGTTDICIPWQYVNPIELLEAE